MAQSYQSQTEAESDEQSVPDVYLPAMPSLSTARGRIEDFVANLLRRRGDLREVRQSR